MDDPFAVQALCLGLLMLSAHFFGRLALKVRLGQVLGQVLGGVVVGPYFLDAIGLLDRLKLGGYHGAFDSFHFLIFTFLGVIAFAVGEELHVDRFRQIGKEAALIAAVQGALTWVLLTGFFLLVGWHWALALVAGSIGVATAPAITLVLLNHLEIEGRFRNMVANILVLSDVAEVILFSIFAQIAVRIYRHGDVAFAPIAGHLGREFGLALLIGLGVFAFLRFAVRGPRLREPEHAHAATLGPGFVSRLLAAHPTPSVEVLVVVIGAVSVGTGLGLGLRVPFLIVGISAGVLIANFHTHALFDSLKIDNVMPLLNLVFFALIGANIRIDSFAGKQLGLVVGYIAMRAVGKIVGTWLGCRWTRQDPKVTACLPLLSLPQAGVAAVEAVYIVALLGDRGRAVADVVLPALVIFEMAGVFFSERSLLKWRGWTVGEREVLSSRDRALRESFRAEGHPFHALAEFVPEGCLGVALGAATLPEAIDALANALERSGAIADRELVVERALARERMGSTAIEEGIVIPHSKTLGQRRTVCAIGVADRPLAGVAGPDGVPSDTVIFLVSPAQRPDAHLRVLATVARVFSDDDFRVTFHDAVRQGRAEELLRPPHP